jgi:hypothetical protein
MLLSLYPGCGFDALRPDFIVEGYGNGPVHQCNSRNYVKRAYDHHTQARQAAGTSEKCRKIDAFGKPPAIIATAMQVDARRNLR